MKNIKLIFKVFALITLLAFASCKKDNVEADKPAPDNDTNAVIAAADLVDYNIALLLSTGSGLRIIYFNKDGNDINATFDAVTSRRVAIVNVVNNTWVLDVNGDGSVIYTFNLKKDKNGRISLISADYKKQDDASVQIQAVVSKNADIPALANAKFIGTPGVGLFIKFSNDHNFSISANAQYTDATWAGYYDLCPGAWKGKYNGADYMGLTVKSDADKPAIMWVQKAGDASPHSFNPL